MTFRSLPAAGAAALTSLTLAVCGLSVTGHLLPTASAVNARDATAGGDGWSSEFTVTPSSKVRMEVSSTAHTGPDALRLTSSAPVRARLGMTSGESGLRAGSTVQATAWVRTATSAQPVIVVLRATTASGTVQVRRGFALPQADGWAALGADLVTRREDSTVTLAVVFARTAEPLDVLVDDVTLDRSGEDPAPDPTPDPTPSPTPDPTPDPPPTPDPDAGVLSNGCTYDARGIPACGAYLGASYGSNTDPARLESQVGRRLGVRRTFWTATGVTRAVATARQDVAHGRIPWISFKLPASWEAMTAGQGDAWATDLATRLAAVPGPVWLAFHHEPEGDGDIQAWRTMQERLAPLVRRIAPNVAYTVVLTGWNQFFGDPRYSLAEIWPRGVKIDIAGFDLYNEYGVTKNGRTSTTWPDFDHDYYAPIQAWAARQGVAWGVAETAYTDQGHARVPGWIETSYDQLVARGGVASTYFDTTLNAYGSWALSTSSKRASLAAPLRDSAALPVP